MTDYHQKPLPSERSVEHSIMYAEQKRKELPKIIQVYAHDWDTVILTDEIYRLREIIKCQKQ